MDDDFPHDVPRVQFSDGNSIPQLGFGVYKITQTEAFDAVSCALEAGYRHIDTATLYGNEQEVGQAIGQSGLRRSDVFVTTKVWQDSHGFNETLRAFDSSQKLLGFDYLDLYLIHWPAPAKNLFVETWKAMIRLQEEGRVKSIGVSNFNPHHIDKLLEETGVAPVINQVELHPYLLQRDVSSFNGDHGIVTQAWAPLGRGNGALDDTAVVSIAEKLDRTPAQVILRWHLQSGRVVIPKSVTPARIQENIRVFDFELTDSDISQLDALNRDARTGKNPDFFD